MTLNEFMAWLEGFEAGFDEVGWSVSSGIGQPVERVGQGKVPNSEQWAAIKAKLALIDAPKVYPSNFRPYLDKWPTQTYEDIKRWAGPTCGGVDQAMNQRNAPELEADDRN